MFLAPSAGERDGSLSRKWRPSHWRNLVPGEISPITLGDWRELDRRNWILYAPARKWEGLSLWSLEVRV